MEVGHFGVVERKPRNTYPWHSIKKIGDGFIIKKDKLPKGGLNGLGRHRGMKLQVTTLKNGDKRVVLFGYLKKA